MTSLPSIAPAGNSNGQKITPALVADWLRVFFDSGEVVELRAIKVERRQGWSQTESGYFDHGHLEDLAAAALEVERHARGGYFTLNPLKPGMLSRRTNRVAKALENELTGDGHVLRRKWLLIDADPVREPADVSATDAEKAEAWNVTLAIRTFLDDLGWTEPVVADSGNGYHLLYRIDL